MRRKAAILFLMLANICLLAHTVIPHHHHNKAVVAILDMSECFGHEEEHHHHDHSHAHSHYHHQHSNHDQHEHGTDSEDCLIDEDYLVSFRTDSRENQVSYQIEGPVLSDLLAQEKSSLLSAMPPETEIIFYNCHANIPPGVIVSSHGLRAPPFC